jgi:DNA-binding response OmpR family regulator
MSTILLIEDSFELADSVVNALKQAGYQVSHAADGPEGLKQFEALKPDLVILDWMLPGLDGLEVLRRIRQGATTPVMMLTAKSEEIDRVLGLEIGADDYLTKPFGIRELLARVHAMLRRVEMLQAVIKKDQSHGDLDEIVNGALRLEPKTYQVFLDGEILDLTRTEFELLLLLVRHPARVFSRPYLLETIWGEQYVPGDRSIDNLILRLRKKLGKMGDCIEALWGVGYRFNLPH